MLRPSVRIVCMPSTSRSHSPSSRPNVTFQYCDVTTGQLSISNGMFMHWYAAVDPPRRQGTVAVAEAHTADADGRHFEVCEFACVHDFDFFLIVCVIG